MSDGEIMMTVLETQRRLEQAEQTIAKLEADEWYKAGMATRAMLMIAYSCVLSFWVVWGVGGVLAGAWLMGQVIAGMQ